MITEETRRESYQRTPIGARQGEVLLRLEAEPRGLTAHELAGRLGWEVYVVRPRLTELRELGRVRAEGKRVSEKTGRSEAVWLFVYEKRPGEMF